MSLSKSGTTVNRKMNYNLANPAELGEAQKFLAQLTVDGKRVSIKEVKPRRSLPQNAYLHLLLGAFGAHFGMTLEEAKSVYKMLPGNKEIYHYTKDMNGKTFEFVRSSANLDKPTMQKTIDTLREWSAKMGYPLPEATQHVWLDSLQNEVERNERYL